MAVAHSYCYELLLVWKAFNGAQALSSYTVQWETDGHCHRQSCPLAVRVHDLAVQLHRGNHVISSIDHTYGHSSKQHNLPKNRLQVFHVTTDSVRSQSNFEDDDDRPVLYLQVVFPVQCT